MVTPSEAKAVKDLAAKAKAGADFDFSKLSDEEGKKLDSLYTSINAKVGYYVPASMPSPLSPCETDADANSYIEKVNASLAETVAKVRAARLKSFAEAFA